MTPATPAGRGFLVLHGNRLEDLRDLVVELVRRDPPPPLVPEVLLVQSNGMKHWLEQALADDRQGLGICAGTQLVLPSAFLWEAYRAVLGREAVPTDLPFDKDALAWRLLRLLPQLGEADAVYAPLQRYLRDDADGRRAWQLAQQLADVLDGYQQYRADWLADWETGGRLGASDEQIWQPALWRALQADVGPARAATSRAAVHRQFVQALAACSNAEQCPAALPPRIIVFGITALPLQSVEALAELGRVCQVILAVQNPCRHYWAHVVGSTADLHRLTRYRQVPKHGQDVDQLLAADDALHADTHALLAAWGKQGRDYLHLLDRFDQTPSHAHRLGRTDVFTAPAQHTATDGPPTLLQTLQESVLELLPPPAAPVATPPDGSVRFVSCHSAQREVEVLHDQVLAWLDQDATLQPGDILVMVPDMAQFAAHVQAVFGRYAPGDDRHVPYSLADLSARQSPLVQALHRWLTLPEGRVTLADWQALFEVASIRRRHGLDEDDVAELRDWLDAAGVRWGLDAAHRRTHGLPADLPGLEQNSWIEGMRRLLLGYATGNDEPWSEVMPLATVGGLAAHKLGVLDDWLRDVQHFTTRMREPMPPTGWVALLNELLDRAFDARDAADAQLLQRLRESLQQWLGLCTSAALEQPLSLCVVRDHWLEQLDPPRLRQRFFGGGVQFATLMPMRSIPFRRVCLLGMNDGDYPRPQPPRDFDLLVDDWRPGDRSRREDDRYLFLEALLSAREALYISWVGHRATDNAEQPPSVLVAQLRDELGRRHDPAPPVEEPPLQPFSSRYFDPDTEDRTYDRDWAPLDAAALPARVAVHAGQAATPPAALRTSELQRLLHQPVEIYWRTRLRVHLDDPATALAEDEPFDYDALEDHRVTAGLIADMQRRDSAGALQRLRWSGALPLAAAGELEARRLRDKARAVIDRAEPWLQAYLELPQPLPLSLHCGAHELHETLPGLRTGAQGLLQLVLHAGAVYQRQGRVLLPRHHLLLRPWVIHVCLAAAGTAITTVLCGTDDELQLAPLPQASALQVLEGWLAVWPQAWNAPLPVAARTAMAALLAAQEDDDSVRECYEGTSRMTGDHQRSAYLRRSFGGYDDIAPGLLRYATPLYGALLQQLQGTGEEP